MHCSLCHGGVFLSCCDGRRYITKGVNRHVSRNRVERLEMVGGYNARVPGRDRAQKVLHSSMILVFI